MSQVRVCFVCLGNICRSPIAEGVFRHLVAEAGLSELFEIDSAGTAGYHTGEPPDRRARAAGVRAGIVVSGRARQFMPSDFARFDYVIAMDRANERELQVMALEGDARGKIRLMRSFEPAAEPSAPTSGGTPLDVPDPYYGDDAAFDHVLELCRVAAGGLIQLVRKERGF